MTINIHKLSYPTSKIHLATYDTSFSFLLLLLLLLHLVLVVLNSPDNLSSLFG
jgi:hypothetical protein